MQLNITHVQRHEKQYKTEKKYNQNTQGFDMKRKTEKVVYYNDRDIKKVQRWSWRILQNKRDIKHKTTTKTAKA